LNAVFVHGINERLGVHKIWIWVMASKVWFRNAILGAVLQAKFIFKNRNSVRPSDTAQRIEEDLEVRMLAEERLDKRKVKNLLYKIDVILGGVDNLHRQRTVLFLSQRIQVHVGNVGNFVRFQVFRGCKDLVRDRFRSGSSVCEVVFDAKVFCGA
jgi:hypothetical protein